MPFEDRSLESVSCLHVAEHIGLGRYGDPLDPFGTRKAATELQRVVAPGGQLLFALPVGRPRVCFNAHRVHSPNDVAAMFPELDLVEFSGVDDRANFRRHRSLDELEGAEYSCGMFRFVRPADASPATAAQRFYEQFVSPGDLVFDVGANEGNRTATFLALGASVVAVEPQAELTNRMRIRWADEPRLTVLECGLSNSEGEAELFVSDANVLTTMTTDWIEATRASGRFAEYRWDERRIVPTATLTSLIDRYGPPAFCKIDVEGFEETVLAGLDRPLRACSLEFASERLPAIRRCLGLLSQLGPVECNYSLGESMELALSAWVGSEELLARIESLQGELPWGDVYVRSLS
jgi:FkbM family methyltransferase